VHKRRRSLLTTVVAAAAITTSSGALVPPPSTAAASTHRQHSRHVLLLSVDGMHQADLTWFIKRHPHSALAGLMGRGTDFTQARPPFPPTRSPGWSGS
jgi:hypothetical protein